MLRASGLEGVAELEGSYEGWKKVQEEEKAAV
jgi:hypothetical protein